MISLKINNLKKMTSLLFTEETFDRFLLHDAEFVTAITTNIDGRKNPDFFEEEKKAEEMETPCIPYKEIRPLCFSLIKGKRLPLSFKIVLLTAGEATEALRKKAEFTACEVSSLSMNFTFRAGELFLTTGIAYKGFSLDKTLEKYWDQSVIKFLQDKEIEFEEL